MVDKRSKTSRQRRLGSVIKALRTRFDGTSSLKLAGKAYALPELARLLQEEIEAMKAVYQAEALRSEAISRERALRQRNKALLVALENLVRGLYGADVRVLSDFALSAPKKPRRTLTVKVDATKKSKATRQVRRTIGKKRKKSAKG